MDIHVKVIGSNLFQQLSRYFEADPTAFPRSLNRTPITWKLIETRQDCKPDDLLCFPEQPCVLIVEVNSQDTLDAIQLMENRLHAFIIRRPDLVATVSPIIAAFNSPAVLANKLDFPEIISDWIFLPVVIQDLGLRVASALKRRGFSLKTRGNTTHHARILSEREVQILRLADCGLQNSILAVKLFLSETTVKWHLRNIYAKFNVKNRTSAIARARELGLL